MELDNDWAGNMAILDNSGDGYDDAMDPLGSVRVRTGPERTSNGPAA